MWKAWRQDEARKWEISMFIQCMKSFRGQHQDFVCDEGCPGPCDLESPLKHSMVRQGPSECQLRDERQPEPPRRRGSPNPNGGANPQPRFRSWHTCWGSVSKLSIPLLAWPCCRRQQLAFPNSQPPKASESSEIDTAFGTQSPSLRFCASHLIHLKPSVLVDQSETRL